MYWSENNGLPAEKVVQLIGNTCMSLFNCIVKCTKLFNTDLKKCIYVIPFKKHCAVNNYEISISDTVLLL